MPELTDPTTRRLLLDGLSVSERGDGVECLPVAAEELRRLCPRATVPGLVKAICTWVRAGKRVEECEEWREEYSGMFRYHYDVRISVAGRRLYVEMRLLIEGSDAEVVIVSIRPDDSRKG